MIKQKGLLLTTIVKGDMETAAQCNNKLATLFVRMSTPTFSGGYIIHPIRAADRERDMPFGYGEITARIKDSGRQMRLFSIFSILEVSKFVFGFF